jgi:GT2 family glycosyltransferase
MMGDPSAPLLSVVIPTYQRRDSVRRALEALARQSLPPQAYEAIVVVDGSTDGTEEMLRGLDLGFPLQVIAKPNGGRAAACNAGIRAASGELVVLLDDDMEVARDFLAEHRKSHVDEPDVGVMGAVPIIVDDQSPRVARFLATKFARHLEMLGRADHGFGLRDFYSGNFSIRRAKLLEAGGFDEEFREYGNEDLELSVRLRSIGVRLRFSETAVARQRNEKDFSALIEDNIRKGRTSVLLARKHPQTLADLKLATFRQGPLLLRVVRNSFLAIGRMFPFVDTILRKLLVKAERSGLASGYRFYTLVLGYFYWTGVRSALAERANGGVALVSAGGRRLRP